MTASTWRGGSGPRLVAPPQSHRRRPGRPAELLGQCELNRGHVFAVPDVLSNEFGKRRTWMSKTGCLPRKWSMRRICASSIRFCSRALSARAEPAICSENACTCTIDVVGGKVTKRAEAPPRSGSWNVLRSGFHAFSGLMWVTPRTPSLRLGIVVVIALAAGGFLLRFTSVEIALLVLVGTLLLAVETLNTSIEMLCDLVQPLRDPKIGKIKDVAAGATAVTEIGGAIVVAILLWPHLWAALHR